MGKIMKNMKVRTKLLTSFGLILLMFIIIVLVGASSLIGAKTQFTNFHNHAFQMSNTTYEMRVNLQRLAKDVCKATMTDDTVKVKDYLDDADARLTDLKSAFAYIEENATTSEFLAMSSEAKGYMEQSKSIRMELFELAESGDVENSIAMYFDQYEPILTKVQEIIIEMDTYSADYADDVYSTALRQTTMGTVALVVIAILAAAFAIAVCFLLSSMITTPIRQVVAVANEMQKGNMHKVDQLTYESKDELGDLTRNGDDITDFLGDFADIKHSLVTILKSFNSTLSDIHIASEQVDAGSDQVAMGAQALSQGATEQAASTEELSATVNEINTAMIDANRAAMQASDKATDAGSVAAECNDRMNDLVAAMKNISDTSNQIGKIIKEIDDIAFQTNILALNAAVEAARAGSAGKGFAVVADEVRNLAGKSAESAKNTAQLIEAAVDAVAKGSELVDVTAERLQQVSGNSEELAGMVQEIAVTAKRTSDAVMQVTTGLDQIAAVVQTNSATAEESAAASEELSSQAAILRERIQRFHLFESGRGFTRPAPVRSEASVTEEAVFPDSGSKY